MTKKELWGCPGSMRQPQPYCEIFFTGQAKARLMITSSLLPDRDREVDGEQGFFTSATPETILQGEATTF